MACLQNLPNRGTRSMVTLLVPPTWVISLHKNHGGQRDLPLLGSGPRGTLSGDFTVYLCLAHYHHLQWGNKDLPYLLARTSICHLQPQFKSFFFSLWVSRTEYSELKMKPDFLILHLGLKGGSKGHNHWQGRARSWGSIAFFSFTIPRAREVGGVGIGGSGDEAGRWMGFQEILGFVLPITSSLITYPFHGSNFEAEWNGGETRLERKT